MFVVVALFEGLGGYRGSLFDRNCWCSFDRYLC